jgi:uncharacterized membrane protein HdeD (DUF308 family)
MFQLNASALVAMKSPEYPKIMAHRANDIETLKQAYSLVPVITKCESLTGLTLIRLPLFAAYLTLLVVGTSVLLRGIKDQSSKN